jgi:mannose-6-phosphate isomerase
MIDGPVKPPSLYPLRLEPFCQYRPWADGRLADLLSRPIPAADRMGEAWLLSDRDDHASIVADGPLAGTSLGELRARCPEELFGDLRGRFARFPLLLKFLDVKTSLSVQVHPADADEKLIPTGNTGKTEAWIVMTAGVRARIFAGWNAPVSEGSLREAIADGTVADRLASFAPRPGDAILIPAGTVHSLSDAVVFEVQQNSDVTFRLHDWGHLDPATQVPRPLQIDQAMACLDFRQGAVEPIIPRVEERWPVLREMLVECGQFSVTRMTGAFTFAVGAVRTPRALVCLAGNGVLEHAGSHYAFAKGDAVLLPAVVGRCLCRPRGTVSVLEIALPVSPPPSLVRAAPPARYRRSWKDPLAHSGCPLRRRRDSAVRCR